LPAALDHYNEDDLRFLDDLVDNPPPADARLPHISTPLNGAGIRGLETGTIPDEGCFQRRNFTR